MGKACIGGLSGKMIHIYIKETRSVTMNIFRKKSFLFKSFVKVKLCFHNKHVQYS